MPALEKQKGESFGVDPFKQGLIEGLLDLLALQRKGSPSLIRILSVTLVRVSDAFSQLAYLLELVLADLVLHIHPPIRILLFGKHLFDPFLEGTAVKLSHVYLLGVETYNFMVFGTLLEDHAFAISSVFLGWNEERLDIRIWDFCLELVVLCDDLFDLGRWFWEILEFESLWLLFASWRETLLVIILIYSGLWWWRNCIESDYRYVNILQKQTRQILLFKRHEMVVVIQEHFCRYLLDG